MKRKYSTPVRSNSNPNYYILEGQKPENGVHIKYMDSDGSDPEGWSFSHYFKGSVIYIKLGFKTKSLAIVEATNWLQDWDYNLKLKTHRIVGNGKNEKVFMDFYDKETHVLSIFQNKNKDSEFDCFSLDHKILMAATV